jgi:hypothetical protein
VWVMEADRGRSQMVLILSLFTASTQGLTLVHFSAQF